MKTEILEKVKKLISDYNEVKRDIAEKIKNWESDLIYSLDYREEKIKELEEQALQCDTLFNKKVKELIAEEKMAIIGKPGEKPADYQLQISNALKFIELAGEKLTDDQAYDILKPFLEDYQTMGLFKPVVEGLAKKGGLDAWNQFNKTFGKTEKFMLILNAFKDAEETSDQLFNFKETGLGGAVRGEMFLKSIKGIQKEVNAFEERGK